MNRRTVSVTVEVPVKLAQVARIVLSFVKPARPRPVSTRLAHDAGLLAKSEEYDEGSCIVWDGTVLNRTVPFLCVGDN